METKPRDLERLVAQYGRNAAAQLGHLDFEHLHYLTNALRSLDQVWDTEVFNKISFSGAEIGFARLLSSVILRNLLGVKYVALASTSSDAMPEPPAGIDSPAFLETMRGLREDVLNRFSAEPIEYQPYKVNGDSFLLYGQPITMESAIPIGAALIASRTPLNNEQKDFLRLFLSEYDTRLKVAEQLLSLQKENLGLSVTKLNLPAARTSPGKQPVAPLSRGALPADLEARTAALRQEVRSVQLFGIPLPTQYLKPFLDHYNNVIDSHLTILNEAQHLFVAFPGRERKEAIDLKDGSQTRARPYAELLQKAQYLRQVPTRLANFDVRQIAKDASVRPINFSYLTGLAAENGAEGDATVRTILEIMNDKPEEDEKEAVSRRSHPYEFHVANLGEVFALLALSRTATYQMVPGRDKIHAQVKEKLGHYPIAKMLLLCCDEVNDAVSTSAEWYTPTASRRLLFSKRHASGFEIYLNALQQSRS